MPEPISEQHFTGPHPTNRDFARQLAAWGFSERGGDRVHTLFRGPHGGTVRVLRSRAGRADPAAVAKAARLAGVRPTQFWTGPRGAPVATQDRRRDTAARKQVKHDSIVSIVLAVHATADRPLGFDQVAEMSGSRVTRNQVSSASASLCRDGHLDRIRLGVYQWSGGQRAALRETAPPATGSMSAQEVFRRLFPAGVTMTAEMLSDLEQWTRLTSQLVTMTSAQVS